MWIGGIKTQLHIFYDSGAEYLYETFQYIKCGVCVGGVGWGGEVGGGGAVPEYMKSVMLCLEIGFDIRL